MSLPAQRPSPSLKLLFLLPALLLFAFAWARLVHPGGLAIYEYWWILTASLGGLVLALAAGSAWQTAGIVACTFLLGFAAQLGLKEPVWFQFIRISPTSNFSYVMLAALVLQGLVAGVVLLRRNFLKEAPGFLSRVGWGKSILLLAVLCAASMGAMDYIGKHFYVTLIKQLTVSCAFLFLNIASVVALTVSFPGDRLKAAGERVSSLISLPGLPDAVRPLDRSFALWAAAGVFVICCLLALFSFESIAHVEDEVAYFFQAKYFAQGHLALAPPKMPEAFEYYLLTVRDGKWFATTAPGWPAVLALGAAVHLPWIVNPLLAAVSILLAHSLFKSLCGRGTANAVTFLMAISPWYLSMSSTLMLHTLTYALILGAWVLLAGARDNNSFVLPLAAGCLMGLLFLTRPLEAVYMGGLTGLWLLSVLDLRRQWTSVIFYGLGCILIGSLIFPYNAFLTGDPLLTPLNQYIDKIWYAGANSFGFGKHIGPPNWGRLDLAPGHSPFEAAVYFQQNLYSLNFDLFGWGIGSLAFALIFALWGKWRKLSLYMASIIVVTVALYALYWFAGCFYVGPRYWFMTFVPLLFLTAEGIGAGAAKISEAYPGREVPQRLAASVGFLCILSLTVFLTWVAVNKYPDIRDFHTDYRDIARNPNFRNSLIFVQAGSDAEYGSAFFMNRPGFKGQAPIFARDLGPEKDYRLAEGFPDRKVYIVEGRNGKSDHIRIVRGPLSLSDLAK